MPKVLRVLKVPRVLSVLVLKVLTVLMVLCPAVSAQTRDTATRGRATGTITGIVVSDDAEARPVRKARVTCGGSPLQGQTTITDDKGRFACSGLAPGRYTIGASKEAWITASYGATRPLRPGSAIPIAAGETADVVLRLPRGSVIAGTLLDHNAQPASGTNVRAYRYATVNGGRRLSQVANTATTDDRGAFRIYGLPPGDYVVGAVGRTPGPAMPAGDLRLTTDLDVRHATSADPKTPPPPERGVAFATTYYPGSTVASQAGVISIGKGEERDGVDFTLQIVPTARIEGIVTLPEGGFPRGADITLVAASPSLSSVPMDAFRSGMVGPEGTFSFAGVSPGQYSLIARTRVTNPDGALGQLVWAATELSVDGEHISGLNLTLAPGMTIAGRVRFEGSLAPPGNLGAVRVSLQTAQTEPTVSFTPPAATVSPDGRFTIAGVTPGRYRLIASFPGSGRPGNWTLRSSVVNGQDSLDIPFVVAPGQHISDASVTFADRLAQLSGAIQSAAGAAVNAFTVILFPADQALWTPQSRRIQAQKPAADGAFTFRNLPPGDYLLAAIDDVETNEWFDPSFLQRLLPTAMKTAIAEGEQKVQDINLSRIARRTSLPACSGPIGTTAGDSGRASRPQSRPKFHAPDSGSAIWKSPGPSRVAMMICRPLRPTGPVARTPQGVSWSSTIVSSIGAPRSMSPRSTRGRGTRGSGMRLIGNGPPPMRSSPPPLAAAITAKRPSDPLRASPPFTSSGSPALRNASGSGTLVTSTSGAGLPALSTRPRTNPGDFSLIVRSPRPSRTTDAARPSCG